MKKVLLVVLLMLLTIPATVMAKESIGINQTENDNECYEGGVMEGKCDTDWEWECGWYLYQLDHGSQYFPEWCESLLEGVPEITVICRIDGGSSIEICLYSNNTGYATNGVTSWISYFGDFGGNDANCPAPPPGYIFQDIYLTEEYSYELYGFSYSVFSTDELFTVLGLGPEECFYQEIP